MRNPLKRKPKPLKAEHDRLVGWLSKADPTDPQYEIVTHRLNDINRILNRASDGKKAWIPALGTMGAIGSLYIIQQFGGILVPKAAETITAKMDAKKHSQELD